MDLQRTPASTKRQIISEWGCLFPELKRYKPNILACRRDPFLVAFEFQFVLGNEYYRPHFVLFTLKPWPQTGKLFNILLYPLRNSNGEILDIKIGESLPSDVNFRQLILQQCLVPIDVETPATAAIVNVFKAYLNRTHSFRENRLYFQLQAPFLAGLLMDEDSIAANQMMEIVQQELVEFSTRGKTDASLLEALFGSNLAEGLEKMINDFRNEDHFLTMQKTITAFRLESF